MLNMPVRNIITAPTMVPTKLMVAVKTPCVKPTTGQRVWLSIGSRAVTLHEGSILFKLIIFNKLAGTIMSNCPFTPVVALPSMEILPLPVPRKLIQLKNTVTPERGIAGLVTPEPGQLSTPLTIPLVTPPSKPGKPNCALAARKGLNMT